MGDSTPSISMSEAADVLRRVADGMTECFVQGGPVEPSDCGSVVFFTDGFEIRIKVDVGCLDYVEWVKAPDGRRCDYEDWFRAAMEVDELAEITDPLGLLSEQEQQALQGVADGLWKSP